MPRTSRGPVDVCAVPTARLAALLDDFIERYDSVAVGADTTARAGRRSPAIGFILSRAQQADPDGRGSSEIVLQRIRKRGTTLTELRVADALVSAIGRPDVFHSGALPIVPNPKSRGRGANCFACGGSTNGHAHGSLTGVVRPR